MRAKKVSTLSKSTKRPRTPVACDRCKLRKQRCDGVTPSCASCTKAKSRCVYSRSFITGPSADVSKYIQTLENEVAVLRKSAAVTQEPTISRNRTYIGETTSGSMIMSVIQKHLKIELRDPGIFDMQAKAEAVEPEMLKGNDTTVVRYVNIYYKRCHYKYPALNRVYFDSLIRSRSSFEDLDHWDAFLIHIVLAMAARCVELSGRPAEYSCEGLYATAQTELNQSTPNSLQNIEALFLCGLYCFLSGSQPHPNCWQLVGRAMRSAAEIGLHRKQPIMREKDPLYQLEFEKRLFWAIYSLDRRLSQILGRPYAIPDEDIDIQLPVEVDESVTDSNTLYQLRMAQEAHQPDQKRAALSNLSCMITNCKLRQIESCIKRRIYSREYTNQSVDDLKQELEQWFDDWPSRDVIDQSGVFYEPVDFMMLNYYRAKKLLLDPAFHKLEPDLAHMFPLFYEYVQSLEGICHTYKLLEQSGLLSYTPDGVSMLFFTGLSLMYCLSLDKQGAITTSAIAHIRVCSNLLHSYSERWPAAKKCRTIFDELIDIVATPRERSFTTGIRHGTDPDVLRPDLWEVPLWDHNPF